MWVWESQAAIRSYAWRERSLFTLITEWDRPSVAKTNKKLKPLPFSTVKNIEVKLQCEERNLSRFMYLNFNEEIIYAWKKTCWCLLYKLNWSRSVQEISFIYLWLQSKEFTVLTIANFWEVLICVYIYIYIYIYYIFIYICIYIKEHRWSL